MDMGHRLLKKPFFVALAAGLILPVGAGVVAPAAQAQFSDSYNFLKAVRDRKGEEAEKFLAEPGTVIINTRDNSTGETALHIVIQRRDSSWLGYLLQKGANPNLADKKGTTPLMLATQLGFDCLARKKAQIDQTNRAGETALILAVQLRNAEAVRVLLKAGANPDKKDSRAGYSARDYALQDGRATSIVSIIENNGKTDAAKKPAELDFSGISTPK
jgi:ankyrin repeat protein